MDECLKLARMESEQLWQTSASTAEDDEVTRESWIVKRALEIWGWTRC